MASIKENIKVKIKSRAKGKVWTTSDFTHSASVESVKKALLRLTNEGFLVRIARGLYLYPKHDLEMGQLSPSLESVAEIIAKREGATLIPTGVHALNKLGLSTQIPTKLVYLTNAAPRVITVGKRTIRFKKTAPRFLKMKGEINRLVVQALKEIGQPNVSENDLKIIQKHLQTQDLKTMNHDAKLAPAWIAKILRDLTTH
jgi:predicted transcriptional regulator of viral defense system